MRTTDAPFIAGENNNVGHRNVVHVCVGRSVEVVVVYTLEIVRVGQDIQVVLTWVGG